MIVYSYDKFTYELVRNPDGTEGVEATVSPLDPDTYLIPANSTTIEPPIYAANNARCFINGAWVYVEDHRGLVVYRKADATQGVVKTLGPIPDTHTLLVPGNYPVWDGAQWIVDPVQWAAEQANAEAVLAYQAFEAAKKAAIIDTMPTWSAVSDKYDTMLTDLEAATTIAAMKVIFATLIKTSKKVARVVYWLARNSET
jgi:hypothetical protein